MEEKFRGRETEFKNEADMIERDCCIKSNKVGRRQATTRDARKNNLRGMLDVFG